ncbi:MAG: phosphate acyltransferase PlsX [Burkholderiaceae bacterium]|jgi:glycerol-3-phosphate acyltransferase PlsX|nr:phosphate acyltransferase PlsX [Burkholderiaceae bacterium]
MGVAQSESDSIKISIDCMGGDHGVSVTVPACIAFLEKTPDAELILVGVQEHITEQLKKLRAENHPRITVRNATEIVKMDDPLEIALRNKRDSSMRVAIEQVKAAQAKACVSAGNTGALMAISRYLLKTLPGVDRPAICAILPNQKGGPTYALDLGANVDCEAEHLHQFAIMGSILFAAIEGKPAPRVGLLNVGTEEIKGNELVKHTGELLRQEAQRGALNYLGNVEGNDLFEGTCDVVVCDGFVGNVTLKSVEGLGRFFRHVLVSEFKSNPLTMLGAWLASRALHSIRERLNPSRFNGASLLGLRGLVFKSHGSADAFAFECAIRRAYDAVNSDVMLRISAMMAEFLRKSEGGDEAQPETKKRKVQEQKSA